MTLSDRVDALPWKELREQLDARGHAVTEPLLDGEECRALADLFHAGRFRSTVDMARHRFGDGRYRYFDHPLPAPVAELRSAFYRHLAPVANDWSALLGGDPAPYPGDLVVINTNLIDKVMALLEDLEAGRLKPVEGRSTIEAPMAAASGGSAEEIR